ncbi:MAG: dTDP-4-dehydrorhamnose reductase [Sphingomonadales bacterium]|jgi:dTDP-4-dehydrorhamnose reductase|nr:dTDP-4-dehydrorhamnose reductase [Sphingomonadales bacterium]
MIQNPPELWAGPECTIVRIGDRWRDQAIETGHRFRAIDVDLIAGLGIKTVRYPILWESVAPDGLDACDFAWADERLSMFEDYGIEVIGGLLHHGSGPAYTYLLDPDFALKFADYAARVVERYPHIRQWTPINEPLTTARFSALYGHWYPHRRDYPGFLRALVNQCDGIRRAMAAIRRINPAATLIQTEDVGKTFSTAPLTDQARHENERRWLSLDLLAGRVQPGHALHRFLLDAGISEAEIESFASGQARPDLIGVNHYLTSERFLDHRIELYPDLEPGGNGRDIYVDAEAVRVDELTGDFGLAARLREVWERYSIPLAITEVHHGCTREQQLRWFAEVWGTAGQLQREGVDLRAVTLWSMFGAVDWRSLVTCDDGAYDVGALDARAPIPRPTAVARAAAAYAQGESYEHPVLAETGWWRRPERLYSWSDRSASPTPPQGPPLLITGATGTLGRAFARIAAQRGLAFRSTDRTELDIRDPGSIATMIERVRPWAIVNTAGFVRVQDAERETDACMAANAAGAANLARACRENGIPLLTFSSDLVFDGMLGRPYLESDLANPVGIYGQSKFMAERLISVTRAEALVIRTSAFFGPWDRHNFAWSVLEALSREEPVSASANDIASPTFVPDLCHAALDLLIDGETGLWHLANQGALSWFAFARAIAQGANLDADLIFARESGPVRNNALASMHGNMLRPFEPALADFLRDVGAAGGAAPPAPAVHSAAINVA